MTLSSRLSLMPPAPFISERNRSSFHCKSSLPLLLPFIDAQSVCVLSTIIRMTKANGGERRASEQWERKLEAVP